jgi:hypothetical protein
MRLVVLIGQKSHVRKNPIVQKKASDGFSFKNFNCLYVAERPDICCNRQEGNVTSRISEGAP